MEWCTHKSQYLLSRYDSYTLDQFKALYFGWHSFLLPQLLTCYRQVVRNLVYLTITQPDIAFPIQVVSLVCWAAILWILCYLKETMNHSSLSDSSSLQLTAYSNSDLGRMY